MPSPAMGALTVIRSGHVLADPHAVGPVGTRGSGASRSAGPGLVAADLLVAGGRIAALTPPGGLDGLLSAGLPEGAAPSVVDAHGLTLLPGLVDAHVHLTGGGGESGFRSRVPRQTLSDLVHAGVTTAVGVLGTDGVTRTMRDLVATTLGLREEGLSAYCFTGNYAVPVVTLTGSVRDDIVFCDAILGVGELAVSDHRSSQPTFDELLRVASDAYVAGLTAGKAGLLHLHLGDGPRGLSLVARALAETELPARVFQPTHLNRNRRLLAEARALCAARAEAGLPQPWFDLTAFPAEDCDGDTTSAAEAALGWWRAGLPLDCLTISSDGGGCLPVFDAHGCMTRMGVGRATTLLETLRQLVAGGMPLALAAPLLSGNPARALMLPRKGHLAAGSDADLIAVDADLNLRAVMARGRILLRDGALLPEGRGVFEKEEP
jgi:beta-aspartyl-dipeptidase (metallo-type)